MLTRALTLIALSAVSRKHADREKLCGVPVLTRRFARARRRTRLR